MSLLSFSGKPGRLSSAKQGLALLVSSWTGLIVLILTFFLLRPTHHGGAELLQKTSTAFSKAKAGITNKEQGVSLPAKSTVRRSKRVKSMSQALHAANCECVYGGNPLSEISEPNVFPGPSEYGPDSPNSYAAADSAAQDPCCAGDVAWGAPALPLSDMRKVYEINEPNFKEWKEFEKENNIFPGIVDWDPDSPKGYNPPFETKELFDGHGGIIGLEDSDNWEKTVDSVQPDEYGHYADGSSTGMDSNVFANGYQFPAY
uniref:Uncharacterized protein n=1 Tax=Hanusia phi TaxID=3032 RepID=A0A7S0I1X4_9CRYP|mmetsp:Transcript_816/g.1755  ORF Transcript_816/g.1755 Transcript_816/m.1755 type:complete len:259 (+) Transcript_816:114-890(+)